MNKAPGTLYLIPVPLHPEGLDTIPEEVIRTIYALDVMIAERAKTARRWIKALCPDKDLASLTIFEIDKHQPNKIEDEWLETAIAGGGVGMLSEAGCPGVADPGSLLVARAHALGLRVKALTGPSSIVLALMGSGFNGQSFAFKGYLSAQTQQRQADLRHLEQMVKKSGQTQIFIETPYRNETLFQSALESLHPQTLFSVALNLGGPESWQMTAKVEAWKTIQRPSFEKIPAIFLIGQWALS